MSDKDYPIDVTKTTLGGALRNGPLKIPNHQREYSWKKDRVRKLFDDFGSAMRKKQSTYFLGTIVVTPSNPPSVIDGQQRLATTCILLAAIRDSLAALGRDEQAKSIEDDFLFKFDRSVSDHVPRLSLNTDDRAYMLQRVLEEPKKRRPPKELRLNSHRRINDAANIAAERVKKIQANADTVAGKVDALNQWVDFIDKSALVVSLMPPSAGRAYQMFKTLNDRAQRTTQADMIKSHLFEQAHPIEDETQSKWTTMRTTIEGMDNKGDDPLLTYLHHVSIVFNGPVVEDDIFEMMEEEIDSQKKALKFVDMLATHASSYAAILTPSDAKWGGYGENVRTYIKNIAHELKMVVVRPLMLAIAERFEAGKAESAFRSIESWVVRFVIAGGHTTSLANRLFGEAAHKVATKEIKTTKGILDHLKTVIPNDSKFHAAFCAKTIGSERLCRWFLRELETQLRSGTRDALLQPVSNTREASLEHVLPKNLNATGWNHFNLDERKYYRMRLGNMVLMNPTDNGSAGDKPYSAKRPILEKSQNLLLTNDVLARADANSNWTKENIDERQKMMAELAVKRWPL